MLFGLWLLATLAVVLIPLPLLFFGLPVGLMLFAALLDGFVDQGMAALGGLYWLGVIGYYTGLRVWFGLRATSISPRGRIAVHLGLAGGIVAALALPADFVPFGGGGEMAPISITLIAMGLIVLAMFERVDLRIRPTSKPV